MNWFWIVFRTATMSGLTWAVWYFWYQARQERARAEYWRNAFYEQSENTSRVWRSWSESIRDEEDA